MVRARFLVGFAIALSGCAVSALAATAPLPQVKEWKESGRVALAAPVQITVGSTDAADRFAAQFLADEIKLHGASASLNATKAAGPRILIGRPANADVARELAAAGLTAAVPDRPESYLIHSGPRGVLVAARDATGLYYGVQTLRQLIRPAKGGIEIAACDIRDWPEMAFRGLSVDLGQGGIPTEAQMQRIVQTSAEYKLNVVSFYMQQQVAFKASPLLAPKGAEIDAATFRRLVEFAARHHVTLLPQQQTFGHMHPLLRNEMYADLGEVRYRSTLTAGDPAVYRWIESATSELTALFPGTMFHAGGDETWDLGKGVNSDAAAKRGVTQLWVEHMTRVADILRRQGRRTMFWGDMALATPALIDQLPKDMIAATWTYEPKEKFANYIAPFRKAGLDVVVCPSVNNWSKPVPDFNKAVANIGRFVAEGHRQGAMGMFNTLWFDDSESLLDPVWYGVVYSAAAAWDGSDYPRDRFDESYDWDFYRAPGTAIAGAVRKLGEVHDAAREVGLVDSSNEQLWLDPYSERGARLIARLLPQAARIRLRSEEAMTAILENRQHCKLHADTLDSLEFGARRLDWLGMKLQFADRIQALYRDAWENQGDATRVNHDLLVISNVNGYTQDLRDMAGEMKEQYRKLWLSVNRPYLLNGMLGLYDRELLYWLGVSARAQDIRANYRVTHKVPDPAEAGMAARAVDAVRR